MGSSRSKLGPTDHAGDVRDDEADPADHAGDGDHAGGHERRRGDHEQAQAPGLDAQRLGLLVAERQHVDAPAQQHQRHEPDQHQRHRRPHLALADGREAAEQPEHDGGQLVVGVGQDLHERDGRAGERADHHAGQHQHQDRVAAVHHRGDAVDEADGGKPHDEGRELDAGHGQRQEDAEHGAEAGAGRHAEDVGRHQRVAEQRLVGGARRRNRRPDDHGREHARQPHLEQHGVDLARGGAPESRRPTPPALAERQRIGPD